MKKYFIILNILLFCLLIIFVCQNLFAGVSENLPLDHWAYNAIEYFHSRGYFENLYMNTKPFNRLEVISDLKRLFQEFENNPSYLFSSFEVYLLNRLKDEFLVETELEAKENQRYARFELNPFVIGSSSENPTEKIRWIPKTSLKIKLNENIVLYNQFEMDTDGVFDSNYRGFNEWKNIVGDMTHANLQVQLPWFKFLFGREEQAWGPSLYSGLILSGNAPSLDMVHISFDFWKFRFSGFHALLNKVELPDSQMANRYLGGSRLDFHFNSNLELGLSQTIIYGGPGLFVQPYYANPFLIYYMADPLLEETNRNNNFVSFDFSCIIKQGLKIYGEYLIDDYVYEHPPDPKEDNPNKVAQLVGIYWSRAMGIDRLVLKTEYARIMNWVYNHNSDITKYSFYKGIIGHWLGPDADNFHVEGNYYLGSNINIESIFSYTRHGEKTIDSPWGPFGYRSEKFPSGIVERMSKIDIKLIYRPSIYFDMSLSAQYKSIINKGNIERQKEDNTSFFLSLNYRFRKFLILANSF